MKAIVKIGLWKAIAFLAAVIFFSGCNYDDQDTPTPIIKPDVLTKPKVVILPNSINTTPSTVTLTGVVIPGGQETHAVLEYRLSSKTNWQEVDVTDNHENCIEFTGNDSVKFTFNITGLKDSSDYIIKAWCFNDSGQTTGNSVCFTTKAFSDYTVNDYDGNLYHTTRIGNQIWIQENFKGTRFANGDTIPNVAKQSTWDNLTTPAYCWYNNNPKLGEIYGGLYNFRVANDSRGLIAGFHTPSLDEWNTLVNYLGGARVAGGKIKETGYDHWAEPNTGANDNTGFDALPGGTREEKFSNLGKVAVFWSSTNYSEIANFGYCPSLDSENGILQTDWPTNGACGFSIRLIKNQ